MDIIISDKWLREYLETKATPQKISECVSLCGPSIERLERIGDDYLYHAEITTNRIDSIGVYGFAREVSAILPRFNIKAKLKPYKLNRNFKTLDKLPFTIISDEKLVGRTMGVVLTNIKNWKTPDWMQKRLDASGVRSLNAVVDITNYVMLETGHPCHAFDYDKIKDKKFIVRESIKGEKITTFDGKTYTLTGGDIVFDNGSGDIIDLPGIMGTKNSVVDLDTKRVFFFIDNNNPSRIRKTSMELGIRTLAASINEKGVDPELGEWAILRGIELYQDICKADVASKVFDIYPKPYKTKFIRINKTSIDRLLGVIISKSDISGFLSALGFKSGWVGDILTASVPSFRANDVGIPEDLIEEIARIYGYHNIPNKLMDGALPASSDQSIFNLEWFIKNILKALGGTEVYTLSLVPGTFKKNIKPLKIKNPLGTDTEYLRTDLVQSLTEALKGNRGNYEKLFIFEIANIYLPVVKNLPDEKMILGMCFDGYKYVEVKGVLETLIGNELHIDIEMSADKINDTILIRADDTVLGYLRGQEDGIYTSELDIGKLVKQFREFRSFIPIPKNPPQIEDLTIKIPSGTEVGNVMRIIKSSDEQVSEIEFKDRFKDSYTFRISYQNINKTLNDSEVAKIRALITRVLKEKLNIII